MADDKESKIVVILTDANDGEAVKVSSNNSLGTGAIRIYPRDKRGTPIDIWTDQLRSALDEIEKWQEENE